MPATMLFNDHHRAQLAHRLNRSLEDTRTRARRAAEARRVGRQLEEEKNQIVAANPNLASVDVHRKTMYVWLMVCILAVNGIDVVLFASVAEYFAKQSFGGSQRLARLAQFLVPAFIVVVEMALSMQRGIAYREYLEGFGNRLRIWAWTAAAVFCSLVMPMAVIAIFLAGEGDDFTPLVSIPLIITLAGLSLVCHVLMLFGGQLALESKAWLFFRLAMFSLQSRFRQATRAYASHSQVAADRFAAYLQDLNAHNGAYAATRIEAGPFDRATREIVNEVYGYEVIQTPAGIRQELAQHKLAPVESVKLTALMTLQAAPFACEAAILHAPVEALVQAGTEAEAVKASKRLMEVLQKGHQQVMARALLTACRNASVQSGFTCIETTPGLDGSIRVIASDSAARALVTEIRADQEWEPSIVTEVVGVTDGSCVGILDQFDRALEEQGVRAGTSDRKWTGGVCELGAAKELLKRIKPGAKAKQEDKRRTRKLNQTPKIHIR